MIEKLYDKINGFVGTPKTLKLTVLIDAALTATCTLAATGLFGMGHLVFSGITACFAFLSLVSVLVGVKKLSKIS